MHQALEVVAGLGIGRDNRAEAGTVERSIGEEDSVAEATVDLPAAMLPVRAT